MEVNIYGKEQLAKGELKKPSNRTKTLQTMNRHSNTERTPACNSTYPKGVTSCSKGRFVVNENLVFHPDGYRDKFCGKSPALRVAANRRTVQKRLVT